MIENFVLNPPQKKGRKKAMKKAKTWRSLVKKYGVKKAAKRYRRGYTSNSVNPFIGKYAYTRKKQPKKRVKVGRYYRKSISRNTPTYAIPATGLQMNPKRRKKSYKGKRVKVAHYLRRNDPFTYQVAPVVANPMELVGSYLTPLAEIKTFWIETALPLTGGFIGSRLLGKKLATMGPLVNLPAIVKNVGLPLGVGLFGGVGTGMITRRSDIGMKVVVGSLVGILVDLIEAPIKSVLKLEGLEEEAENMTEELKARIARAIKSEVAKAKGVGAFVSEEALPAEGPELGTYVDTDITLPDESVSLSGPRVGDVSLENFMG